MSELSDLAEYLVGLDARTLPPTVREATRLHVLDSIAAQISGVGSDVDRALGLMVGHGSDWDALVGAALAHCHEVDDIFDDPMLCIGGLVVSTALAYGRALGSSGAEVMAAVVAGYEAMGRLGLTLGSASLLGRGWWPSAVCGAFGSAAVTGRLLRLSAPTMVSALTLAGMNSGGTMGGSASIGRHLLYGNVARTGVLAAVAAEAGFAAPAGFLSGPRGLGAAYGCKPQLRQLSDGLGERFMVSLTSIKPYACARQLHGAVEITLSCRLKSVDCGAVERMLLEVPAESAFVNTPVGDVVPNAPAGSAQWILALALVKGRVLPVDLTTETLSTSDVHDLARRIQVEVAPPGARAALSCSLEVRMRGSNFRREVPVPIGGPLRPMSAKEVASKARDLVSHILGANTSRLVDLVGALEDLPRVDEIAALRTGSRC